MDPSIRMSASQGESSYAASNGLRYDGQLRDIFKLWLLNTVLFFVTLSLYRFWGRTRVRQYVWRHISLQKDRLEYSGTGLELFIGFMITWPVFILLGMLQEFVGVYAASVLLLYVLLAFWAIYAGIRYRVNRTSWRAVHGFMPVSGHNKFLLLSFKRSLINLLTLGYAKPRSDLLKWKCLVEHMYFGTIQARFDYDMKHIISAHIWSVLLGFIFTVIFIALYVLYISKDYHSFTDAQLKQSATYFVVFMYIILFPTAYLFRLWYQAVLVRKKFSGISIGNAQFSAQFSILRYVGFQSLNLLILIATLGLGSAFILHRKARFFCRYIHVRGTLDEVAMAQTPSDKNRLNEGLIDAFGFDLAFLS